MILLLWFLEGLCVGAALAFQFVIILRKSEGRMPGPTDREFTEE